jgi:hypothetical protein
MLISSVAAGGRSEANVTRGGLTDRANAGTSATPLPPLTISRTMRRWSASYGEWGTKPASRQALRTMS